MCKVHHYKDKQMSVGAARILLVVVTKVTMLVYLSVFVLFICFLHCALKYNEKTRLIRKIPGPKEIFLIGNALEIIVSPVELFKLGRDYAHRFNGIYSWWSCLLRTVNIYNPEDIEIVISSSKHNDKDSTYELLKPWLREGLLLSNGSKWQQRRKILTPAFHFQILRKFGVTLEENSQRLVENLAQSRGEVVDVAPVLSDYTLNSICETAMGTSLHQTKNFSKSYKNAIYELGKVVVARHSHIYYRPQAIFNMSSLRRQQNKHLTTAHSFTEKIIRERRDYVNKHGITINTVEEDDNNVFPTNRKSKIAMLDLLISAEKEGTIDPIGTQEEVDTFLFEGHDTTASGLIFCLMLLANNKNIQDKILAELQDVFGDSTRLATMQDLSAMRYLECCIKESLRLYPPVPFISRKLTETVTLSNYIVPEGTVCNIHVYDLHRREDLYKNSETFDPDRFLAENSVGRHLYAYIPFSAGPRNCIGQRFAMMELKSCVAAILRRFELQPVTRPEDLLFTTDLVLRNTKPVYVKFVERN